MWDLYFLDSNVFFCSWVPYAMSSSFRVLFSSVSWAVVSSNCLCRFAATTESCSRCLIRPTKSWKRSSSVNCDAWSTGSTIDCSGQAGFRVCPRRRFDIRKPFWEGASRDVGKGSFSGMGASTCKIGPRALFSLCCRVVGHSSVVASFPQSSSVSNASKEVSTKPKILVIKLLTLCVGRWQ